MNPKKMIAKLSKMSGAEISFRVNQKLRNTREQMRAKNAKDLHNLFVPKEIANWPVHQFPFPDGKLKFFGLSGPHPGNVFLFENRFPGRMETLREEADDLLAHRFHLLGQDFEVTGRVRWNANPQTGEEYPLVHFSALDTYNTERYGDVKYVWELNRHQFFVELGRAYYLTGEEKYAHKIWEWLSEFVEDAPYKIGVNHTSVLEHAVRIFSWVWAYYFTRDAGVWNEERTRFLARQLLLQGEIIEENLSHFFSPYNHLIGEIAALAFLGTVYPNSPKTLRWRDHYWQEMEKQLPLQFHPDGFTVEQASYYHHFTLGFYYQVARLRKQNGLPVSDKVWSTLEKALEFSMALVRPDGLMPMIGDIDSARSIYFYRPEPMWDLTFFQALGAVQFGRGDMKHVAGALAEEVLWLHGEEGVAAFDELHEASPAAGSRLFKNSGYAIMRDGWEANSSFCLFDCGEIAHGVHSDQTPSAAHGHSDMLSIDLCLDGKPVVIDPGFHTYFGPLDWHRYFRGASGHNTISVDGADHAIHEGRIAWSGVSTLKRECWVSNSMLDLAGASIDRFAGLPEKISHRRYVLFVKDRYFLLLDEIHGPAGPAKHRIESYFHFSEGQLSLTPGRAFFNDRLAAAVAGPPGMRLMGPAPESQAVENGWKADGYGQKTPAPVMKLICESTLPFFSAVLFPLPAFAACKPRLQLDGIDARTWRLRISYSGGEEDLVVNAAGQLIDLPQMEGFRSDAVVSLRRRGDGPRGDGHENEILLLKADKLQREDSTVNLMLSNGTGVDAWSMRLEEEVREPTISEIK